MTPPRRARPTAVLETERAVWRARAIARGEDIRMLRNMLALAAINTGRLGLRGDQLVPARPPRLAPVQGRAVAPTVPRQRPPPPAPTDRPDPWRTL